jgi:hypothetical protein
MAEMKTVTMTSNEIGDLVVKYGCAWSYKGGNRMDISNTSQRFSFTLFCTMTWETDYCTSYFYGKYVIPLPPEMDSLEEVIIRELFESLGE